MRSLNRLGCSLMHSPSFPARSRAVRRAPALAKQSAEGRSPRSADSPCRGAVRLSDEPPAPAPGLVRLVEELGEHACGSAGALLFFLGVAHFLGDLSPQALVPCKAKDVVHRVFFAPGHPFLAAEPGVRSQDEL